MSLRQAFTDIYDRNSWRSSESRSGQGSTLEATDAIRTALPALFAAYGIDTVLDIPCGDYAWWWAMDGIPWIKYVGADIVPALIENNRERYPLLDFRVLDLVSDTLPIVDLVFCRDCLGHLSNPNVRAALANIRASGAKWLMATTYHDPKWSIDAEILDGGWRPVNMIRQFGLGEPVILVNEGFRANPEYADKSLGLWRL